MKDLLAMLWKVIKPGERKPGAKRVVSEGYNVMPQVERKPLPPVPPPSPPVIRREVDVKNKKRIDQLRLKNRQLQDQLDNQTELLERVVKDLAQLRRDVAHVLPEK